MSSVGNRLVFISSTGRDLPEERKAVRTACDELGLAIVDMKDFPATGAGATAASLAQLDRTVVYVGIFAHRYGYVEPGYPTSVTECEYDHAGTRGLARLCFLLHPSVAWPDERIEHAAWERLAAFKERVTREQVVRWFANPHDLLHQAYRALEHWLREQGETRGPCTLPAPPPDFVGREEELSLLERHHDTGVTISGVRGQGGVGKTTLALKLAERLALRCPAGQLYLNLRGTDSTPMVVREAQAEIVRLFRGRKYQVAETDEGLLHEYRATLAGKRVLLLLDNAVSAEQVEPLLPPAGTPAIVLVTSRRRFLLPGLRPHELDALPLESARTLLLAITPRLLDAEAGWIASTCGRLPLAVRLAGATLANRPDLSAAEYLRRLEVRGRLRELDPVKAAIRLSEDQLPDSTKAAWPRLALFAGGFEKRWAAAVWDVDEFSADDHIARLLEHSLLTWNDGVRLYRLHDLVREYATDRLAPATGRDGERRHGQLFRDELIAANALYRRGGQHIGPALLRFDRAWPEILAAFERAVRTPDDPDALRLMVDLALRGIHLHGLRRTPVDVLGWLQTVVEASRRLGDRRDEAYALGSLGVVYRRSGAPGHAVECHERQLAITRELGDRAGEGLALGYLGSDYRALKEPLRARAMFDQDLAIARELGDQRAECRALGGLGNVANDLGEPRQAVAYHQQTLVIALELGERWREGRIYQSLGEAHVALEDAANALTCFERQRDIARELGERWGEVNACWNQGLTLVVLGRLAEAVPLLESRATYRQEIGHADGETDAAFVAEIRRRLTQEDPAS